MGPKGPFFMGDMLNERLNIESLSDMLSPSIQDNSVGREVHLFVSNQLRLVVFEKLHGVMAIIRHTGAIDFLCGIQVKC